MYSLEVTNILYPTPKLLIKDIYNFFSSEVLSKNPAVDYESLLLLHNETLSKYNININKIYILSTPSLSLRIFKKLILKNIN